MKRPTIRNHTHDIISSRTRIHAQPCHGFNFKNLDPREDCSSCSTQASIKQASQQVCRLQLWVSPERKQSCAPPAAAGHQQRHPHDQLGGWCVLRADYPGRQLLFCASWLWDCTLCVLLIRPRRRLSPAADLRARPSVEQQLRFSSVTANARQFWALDILKDADNPLDNLMGICSHAVSCQVSNIYFIFLVSMHPDANVELCF